MPSFFEKLRKGMGIETSVEEEEEKIEMPKKTKIRKKIKERPVSAVRIKKIDLKEEEPKEEKEMELPTEPEVKEEKIEIRELSSTKALEAKEKWSSFNQESVGQLAVDIYQTTNDLVIQSAIAGVRPESLDVTMEKDIITISGIRERPFEENGDFFTQECYWGPFSREVILPAEVDPNRALAEMKDGILTIRIPKILREKKRKIVVRGS